MKQGVQAREKFDNGNKQEKNNASVELDTICMMASDLIPSIKYDDFRYKIEKKYKKKIKKHNKKDSR